MIWRSEHGKDTPINGFLQAKRCWGIGLAPSVGEAVTIEFAVDIPVHFVKTKAKIMEYTGAETGIKGKTVKFRRGPAAVNGDDSRTRATVREKRMGRRG